MDLSGLSAIAPGYLQGQASQASTAVNRNTADAPAALAALLQALGVTGGQQQGPAGLGQRIAPQQVQSPGGGGDFMAGPIQLGGPQWPQGGNPNPGAMFEGNGSPSTFASGGPDMNRFDFNSSGNPGGGFPNVASPSPGYGRYQVLQPPVSPPSAGGAPAGPAPAGGGGAANPPSQSAAAPPQAPTQGTPNLPPQTKAALYQMPLQDIVAAVKQANPKIDDRTLGLGLQALSPFLNQQAQRDLAEQRMFYTNQLHDMQQQNTEQRLDFARQRLDPATQAGLSGARQAGTIASREEPAAAEAISLLDNAVQTSAAVPRDQWQFANKLIQMGENQASDPKLADLKASLWGVVNTYTRAIAAVNGRAATVNDKTHAESILSAVQSQQAFEAAANKLKYEVETARYQTRANLARQSNQKFDEAAPVAPPPGGVGGGAPVVIDGYTITPR